jgi:hypothetical protein
MSMSEDHVPTHTETPPTREQVITAETQRTSMSIGELTVTVEATIILCSQKLIGIHGFTATVSSKDGLKCDHELLTIVSDDFGSDSQFELRLIVTSDNDRLVF